MNARERRKEILKILQETEEAISGKELAELLGVSRQVIVQDIALIRAGNINIISTYKGYMVEGEVRQKRIFKVRHNDDDLEEELNIIADAGGEVVDVFVLHDVYGKISASLDLGSRRDIRWFMGNIREGKASTLKKLTDDVHFHTVEAKDEETLDFIQEELKKRGYLAD